MKAGQKEVGHFYHINEISIMKSIEIVMLPVKDQQKAKEFYFKLGYKVIVEAPMGKGETWLQMGLPGSSTTLSLGSFHAIICETPDIEKDAATLRSKGIEVGAIDDTPWGRFAWLKDPDGNSTCLRQAATPSGS
jgi:catechol 2,3-dioxygenase-like lactoylglutathione lyase family enzyme